MIKNISSRSRGQLKPEIDITLVLTNYRHCMVYPTVIQSLAKKYKIAILERLPSDIDKIRKSHNAFLKFCQKMGAQLLNKPVPTRLLILPSRAMDDTVDILENSSSFERVYAITTLEEPYSQFQQLKTLKIQHLFTHDQDRMMMDRTKEQESFIHQNFEISHIGNPYRNFEMETIPDIDYLIAIPTHVGIPDTYARFIFNLNLYRLVSKMDKNLKIILKTHPARDQGNSLFNKLDVMRLQALPGILRQIFKLIYQGLLSIKRIIPEPMHNLLYHTLIRINNSFIADKSEPLEQISGYSYLSIEYFLKYVRKGLITGSSISIFHALLQNVPVYNLATEDCDNVPDQIHRNNKKYPLKPVTDLNFDVEDFNILGDRITESDIISELKSYLELQPIHEKSGAKAI